MASSSRLPASRPGNDVALSICCAPTSQRDVAPIVPIKVENPFQTLMDTLRGNWADVNGRVHMPTMALGRLHLETVALIRALHGNRQTGTSMAAADDKDGHEDSDVLRGMTSSDDCDGPAVSVGRRSGKLQNRRRKAARTAYEQRAAATSRLLDLEPDLFALRDEVARLQAYGQAILQAAYSVSSELDFVADQITTLKTSNTAAASALPMNSGDISSGPARAFAMEHHHAGPSHTPQVPNPPSPMSAGTPSSSSSSQADEGSDDGEDDAFDHGRLDLDEDEAGALSELIGGPGPLTPVVLEGSSKFALTDYFQDCSPHDQICSTSGNDGPAMATLGDPPIAKIPRTLVAAALPRLSLKRRASCLDSLGSNASPDSLSAKFMRPACVSR
ncbi:unnamed protein product [Parajaminaea phylloscopi]